MAIASYKDLCIDANHVEQQAVFYSAALGLQINRRDGNVWLSGPTPAHTIWMNAVPEPTTAKNRAHLDVHCGSIAELEALGATVAAEQPPGVGWTIMTDPEGQVFCGFVRETVPDYRLYEIVVDCADPHRIAEWWAAIFGAEAGHDVAEPWSWLEPVPSAPFAAFTFSAVPEPKAVKNRVHWDVSVDSLDPLLAAGATLLRAKGDEVQWNVLADPEGNEFCAFVSD
ncbi:MAG: VOC family protein [Jatrophihabitans sp.]